MAGEEGMRVCGGWGGGGGDAFRSAHTRLKYISKGCAKQVRYLVLKLQGREILAGERLTQGHPCRCGQG